MSAHTTEHAGHGHPHSVRAEPDRVNGAAVALVGVASLVVFFLGSLAAVTYLRVRQAERGPIEVPAEIGQSKIGLVEQQAFGLSQRGERARVEQLRHLSSFGWVDRSAGVAHIPIEEAMRLVAAGVRPGPAGGAPPPGGQP